MRIIKLISFLLIITNSYGQTTIEFNADGKLTTKLEDYYLRQRWFVLSPLVLQSLTAEEQTALKKKFYLKFQRVVYNLTDSGAANFYRLLWDSKVYDQLVSEARALKQYYNSKDTTEPAIAFAYFPSPSAINTMITAGELYALDTSYKQNNELLELKLLYIDPLKTWLINRYNNDIRSSSYMQLDNPSEYKRLWKQLEDKIETIDLHLSQLRALPPYICDNENYEYFAHQTIIKEIDNDVLINLFKKDPLHKSWIWFTDGLFSVNPLGFTPPDKIIPGSLDNRKAELFDLTIKRALDSLSGCCDIDIKKTIDLVRVSKTGKKIFTEQNNYKDDVFEIESIDQLKTTKVIRNKVIIPMTTDIKKKKVYIIHMDGANDYKQTNKIPKAITENESTLIAVHNLTSIQKISLEEVKAKGVDKSEGEKQVDAIADQIGVVIAGLNPFGGFIKNVFKPLQRITPNMAIPPPKNNFPETVDVDAHFMGNKRDKSRKQLTIDGVDIELLPSMTEKQLILKYIFLFNKEYDTAIVNAILSNCHLPVLDKRNDQNFKLSGKDIIKSFKTYYHKNVTRNTKIDSLMVRLRNDSLLINALLNLKDRSLPPEVITGFTGKNPDYRTEILKPDLSDPPIISKINLIEKMPKASGTDTSRTVSRTEIRVGKLYLFQLSTGIGVTLREYSSKTASNTGNQISVESNNNQVRVLAGLHIYPWKLFKQDDSFLGIKSRKWKNRLYTYVGIGIPDPLKNYYVGVGTDFIPGFKFTTGAHLFRNYKYKLNNNHIVQENSSLKYAGPFISFSIEPATFVKALGFFK